MAKNRHGPKAGPKHVIARAMAASKDCKTQSALGKKAGVSQTTIGRMLRGEVDPQSDTLWRVAAVLGIDPRTLLEKPVRDGFESRIDGSALEFVKGSRWVPLLSWVKAGAFAETIDNFEPGDADDWFYCPKRCGAQTFALRVEGASMEPHYEGGDVIFVDPDVDPINGRDVVVRLEDDNEVAFKQLVVERGRRYLRSLNPNWPNPVIEVSGAARIVGVVIGKWSDRG